MSWFTDLFTWNEYLNTGPAEFASRAQAGIFDGASNTIREFIRFDAAEAGYPDPFDLAGTDVVENNGWEACGDTCEY